MGTEHYVKVRGYRFDGEYDWSLFIMADPIEWRRELLDGGDSSLTGGSFISKSDRPYTHSSGAVAASARHSTGQRAIDVDHHLTYDPR